MITMRQLFHHDLKDIETKLFIDINKYIFNTDHFNIVI